MITLNIGVIGAGYWGTKWCRVLNESREGRLYSVCDQDPQKLDDVGKQYPSVRKFRDASTLLADQALDAVVIASPATYHFPLALAALQAGKHVLVEKPLALSVKDCDVLINEAQKQRRILMVGHTFLYSPAVRKVRELIQDGRIGKVLHIESRRLALGLFQRDINVIWDLNPHCCSILLYLLGQRPHRVQGEGIAYEPGSRWHTATVSMKFPCDATATLHSSWIWPRKIRELTIIGTHGAIYLDDTDRLAPIRLIDQYVETPGQAAPQYHRGEETIIPVEQQEPLANEARHFIDSIRSFRQPISCGHQGRDVVDMLEKASR